MISEISTNLKSLLDHHDNLYYNQDNPELSDAEYDALKARYLQATGEMEYNFVPGEAVGKKVTHAYPVTSLAKVNSEAELRAAIEPLMPVVIQPKFDGLTLVVYEGKAATRGNGFLGEDVTHTAKRIHGMDKYLDSQHMPIRGEVLMPISVFNDLNARRVAGGLESFKNPRNAAAGMLRNKDASKVEGLKYYFYDLLGSRDSETVKLNLLDDNAAFDCRCTPSVRFENIDQAVEYVMNYDRAQHDYEIDGLVIKSDIMDSLRVFGSTGHHPKNAVAYKFPSQGQWTTLKSVVWQVGRTGKVTPVAEFEPVDLMGSIVGRATLHNIGIMNALGLREGCEVFVAKANDVIPAILECRGGEGLVPAPQKCPECGDSLELFTDQHFCHNPGCPAQIVAKLVHLAKRDALDIEGLSEETAGKMFSSGLIEYPYEIFTLTENDLLKIPGYAAKSAAKLYANIQKSRKTDLKRFFYAIGAPNIGRSISEDLSKAYGSLDAFLEDRVNLYATAAALDGIGNVVIQSLLDYTWEWEELSEYVSPLSAKVVPAATPGKVLTIVVTGSFMEGDRKVSRDEIEAMIKDAGHKASGSVSKKTDLVLVGEAAGSKADKARELGVKTITTLDELRAIIG